MCCCPEVSAGFVTFSVLAYIIVFVATLLNMIFSAINPGKGKAFIYSEDLDFSQPHYLNFLMDLDFGENLIGGEEYGFGSTGASNNICIEGTCKISNKEVNTLNCSKSCLQGLNECYNEQNLCEAMSCDYDPYYFSKTKQCEIFSNKINLWRKVGVKKIYKKVYLRPLYHIISSGECPYGYQLCGKINEEDYLCLKPDEENGCPINKIVVSDTNSAPNDNYIYKSSKFGDKYIFYTNQNGKDNIIDGFSFQAFVKPQNPPPEGTIDSDKFINVLESNPKIYSGKYTIKHTKIYEEPNDKMTAYLKNYYFKLKYTLKEILILQEKYKQKKALYSEEKIQEMNDKIIEYKGLLLAFGISSFASFALVGMIFIPVYSCDDCGKCGLNCSKKCLCVLCVDITPIKRVVVFYLVCLPTVIFSPIGFYITLTKKMIFNDYLSMPYLDDFKNKDFDFQKSITYNNILFILLSIITGIIILYPLLVKLTSCLDDDADGNDIGNIQKNNIKNINKRNKKSDALLGQLNDNPNNNILEYNPPTTNINSGYNNVYPPQNNNSGYNSAYPPQNNYNGYSSGYSNQNNMSGNNIYQGGVHY